VKRLPLRQRRRVATRYEKHAAHYLAMLTLGAGPDCRPRSFEIVGKSPEAAEEQHDTDAP
jgi:hypothetical protein